MLLRARPHPRTEHWARGVSGGSGDELASVRPIAHFLHVLISRVYRPNTFAAASRCRALKRSHPSFRSSKDGERGKEELTK